jgi:hypothetical protein
LGVFVFGGMKRILYALMAGVAVVANSTTLLDELKPRPLRYDRKRGEVISISPSLIFGQMLFT